MPTVQIMLAIGVSTNGTARPPLPQETRCREPNAPIPDIHAVPPDLPVIVQSLDLLALISMFCLVENVQ